MTIASTGAASVNGSIKRPLAGPGRQRGMGLVGWLLVLILLGFAGLVGLRVMPVYLEAMTVSSVVEDVARNPELPGASPQEVRSALSQRLQVNGVETVTSDHVDVERSGDSVSIVIEYERRFPLIANLDGVASFREEATIDP